MRKYLLYMVVTVATIVGCQKDPDVSCYSSDLQQFVVSIPETSTRVNFEDNSTGVTLTWESDDKFSLYDAAGDYVADLKFSATNESGKSVFELTDDTVALTDGETYTAIYPALESAEETIGDHRAVLASRIKSQTQSGNSDNRHLNDALRMEAEVTYDEDAAEVNITFVHKMATARFSFATSEQPTKVLFKDGDTTYTLSMESLSSEESTLYVANLVIEPNATATSRTVSVSIYGAGTDPIESKSKDTDLCYEAGYQYRLVLDSVSSISDITAETTTTPYLYKSTEGGTDLYIYHVATEAALVGEPKAAIIFFHGGGWSSGSYTTFLMHCEYLATQGIVGFTAQYRVTGSTVETVSILDCLRDARSAVRWVKANAEQFNVDPNKILTGGGSAGGCLAAGVSMSDDEIYDSTDDTLIPLDIAANVLFNPVVHNVAGTSFAAYNASGVSDACTAENFAVTAFSPFSNVDADVPPTIFLVGENDTYIPPATAIEYQRMIEEVNGTCELWFHENKEHSFYNFYDDYFGATTSKSATGFTATMPYVHDFLRERGFINDNSSQVVDWLMYGGYNNYVYVDNFLYDTSNTNIAADYTEWCSDNDYADMPTLGTNLVVNGDFERGDYEGWTAQSETYQSIVSDLSYVIDGNYSLLSSGSWQKIYQQIAVEPGVRYYFGFEGRHTSTQQEISGEGTANTGSFQLSLRTVALNGSSEIVQTSSISSIDDVFVWSSTAFESNITSVYFTLALQGGYGTSDNFFFAMSKEDEEALYGTTVEGFDPLPLWTPENEEPVYEGNMLINGDFETGSTSPWVSDAGATISIVSEDYAVNGYHSLAITSAWPRVYQVVQVEGGKTYKYGFKGRQLAAAGVSGGTAYGSGQRVSLSIKTGSPLGTVISGSEIAVYGAGTDTSKDGTFTVPSDATEIYFMINSSGGYAYMDSVYMLPNE